MNNAFIERVNPGYSYFPPILYVFRVFGFLPRTACGNQVPPGDASAWGFLNFVSFVVMRVVLNNCFSSSFRVVIDI